jgi:hypothetical protein
MMMMMIETSAGLPVRVPVPVHNSTVLCLQT